MFFTLDRSKSSCDPTWLPCLSRTLISFGFSLHFSDNNSISIASITLEHSFAVMSFFLFWHCYGIWKSQRVLYMAASATASIETPLTLATVAAIRPMTHGSLRPLTMESWFHFSFFTEAGW